MHYFVLFLEVSTIEMLEAKFPAVKVLFVSKIFSSIDLSVNRNLFTQVVAFSFSQQETITLFNEKQ